MSIDKTILAPGKNLSVEVLETGFERQPLLIAKDFMRGADRLRDYAVENSANFKLSDSYYPGIRLEIPLIYALHAVSNLRSQISEYFNLDFAKLKRAAARFSIVTTRPAQLQLLQKIPHFDAPSKKSLAMIHFLCDTPNSGTAFYRHKDTGFEYVDGRRYSGYMDCVKDNFLENSSHPEGYIGASNDVYEMIHSVPSEQNKLILYFGTSLHSGIVPDTYDFDPNPASGRLTITSFIEFE